MRNLLFFILASITASSSAFAADRQTFVGAWELVKIEEYNDNFVKKNSVSEQENQEAFLDQLKCLGIK